MENREQSAIAVVKKKKGELRMKNRLFFVILLLLGTVALSGCGQAPALSCRIVDGAEEKLLLLADMDGSGVYRFNPDGVPIKGADALKDGMTVKIEFGGQIQETFPATPVDVRRIVVDDVPINDTAGLCFQVFDDLWKDHPGLGRDVEYLGVDLSAMEGLTDSERLAVAWHLGEKTGLTMLYGTLDELMEQGYIDKARLSWEDGVFFSVEGDTGGFDAQMWRAGDAACYLKDCIYTEKDGVWSYSSGSFAVS